MALPPAPQTVVCGGLPAFGRYQGLVPCIDWSELRGPHRRSAWWRRFHHKRWQYVGVGSDELFIGMAIVDIGWAVTAFAYVFCRARKQVLVDWSQTGLPCLSGDVSDEPVQGSRAWFTGPGARLALRHGAPDVLTLRVDAPGLQMDLCLDLHGAAPFLLAVGPIDRGVAHATQKSSALLVSGSVQVGAQRWEMGQATGCLDSSNGLLARETDWRWACAHSPQVGFNLQQGYFGGQENALWLDGRLIPVGPAHFEFDPQQPLMPWHIHSEDGLIDLTFQPEGARREDRNLWVAASRYIQPVGTFQGWVKPHADARAQVVDGLLGVTEDHRSRW